MSTVDDSNIGKADSSLDTGSTQKVDSIYKGSHLESNNLLEGESFCLEVLSGPTKGDLIFFSGDKNSFGRDQDCTVMLDDITVSRHHCEIVVDNNEVLIKDSGSTNGTYVNSNAIESSRIVPGDVIQIGKFVFALARRTQK